MAAVLYMSRYNIAILIFTNNSVNLVSGNALVCTFLLSYLLTDVFKSLSTFLALSLIHYRISFLHRHSPTFFFFFTANYTLLLIIYITSHNFYVTSQHQKAVTYKMQQPVNSIINITNDNIMQ